MRIDVLVPNLPESVSDALVQNWHKKPGDRVRRDENLVDLETDKVILEVPAIQDGVVTEIRLAKGARVKSGECLAILDTESARTPLAEASVPPTPATAPMPAAIEPPSAELSQLPPGARKRALAGEPAAERGLSAQAPHEQPAGIATTSLGPVITEGRTVRREPMSPLRERVADRLLTARQQTAMLTTFNEVNLEQIANLRKVHGTAFEKRHGVKLGYMSFFVRAAVTALKRFAIINAGIDGKDIVYHDYQDIGIAVSTERGLVVPVLRDAERLNFADIERAITEFAVKAREGKLSLDDLTGGTFTITNGGIFGSLMSTPIINPPQSAILGMHAIKERPIAEQGQVVIRPMMYLALSYDHRLIDGKDAVQFLAYTKEQLEDPQRMLLEL